MVKNWAQWAGLAAAAWSLAYGLPGLWWALGGAGFPFGRADPDWEPGLSVLGDAQPAPTGWATAALGLLGAIAGIAMARGWVAGNRPAAAKGLPGILRHVMPAFAWTVAAALTIVIADSRVLIAVAYAPLLAVWAFTGTGVPGGQSMAELMPWSRINLLILVVGA
ncbi:hypothetical protein [Nonomuraea sp. NPDC050202]|uniref:hypothetical protein n=1 Tax=Nonomuraea sp. NPDC050202 TaxID=3155035 RepID=UPI0033FBC1D4